MEVTFSGDCGVSEAEALKGRLLQALAGGQSVTVSFAAVTGLDISFFELLHAARKCFDENGVELVFLSDLPREFSQRAAWAGLSLTD